MHLSLFHLLLRPPDVQIAALRDLRLPEAVIKKDTVEVNIGMSSFFPSKSVVFLSDFVQLICRQDDFA
jgi:hypothetical protein